MALTHIINKPIAVMAGCIFRTENTFIKRSTLRLLGLSRADASTLILQAKPEINSKQRNKLSSLTAASSMNNGQKSRSTFYVNLNINPAAIGTKIQSPFSASIVNFEKCRPRVPNEKTIDSRNPSIVSMPISQEKKDVAVTHAAFLSALANDFEELAANENSKKIQSHPWFARFNKSENTAPLNAQNLHNNQSSDENADRSTELQKDEIETPTHQSKNIADINFEIAETPQFTELSNAASDAEMYAAMDDIFDFLYEGQAKEKKAESPLSEIKLTDSNQDKTASFHENPPTVSQLIRKETKQWTILEDQLAKIVPNTATRIKLEIYKIADKETSHILKHDEQELAFKIKRNVLMNDAIKNILSPPTSALNYHTESVYTPIINNHSENVIKLNPMQSSIRIESKISTFPENMASKKLKNTPSRSDINQKFDSAIKRLEAIKDKMPSAFGPGIAFKDSIISAPVKSSDSSDSELSGLELLFDDAYIDDDFDTTEPLFIPKKIKHGRFKDELKKYEYTKKELSKLVSHDQLRSIEQEINKIAEKACTGFTDPIEKNIEMIVIKKNYFCEELAYIKRISLESEDTTPDSKTADWTPERQGTPEKQEIIVRDMEIPPYRSKEPEY